MFQMIAEVVRIFFNILDYAILARCILSWLPIDRNNPVSDLIYSLTEPVLAPVRNMVYRSPIGESMRMIDFSPVIAMLILSGVQQVLVNLLYSLG